MMIASNGRSVDGSPVWKKRIRIPQPAQRLIFIDEGLATPDAYSVRYATATERRFPARTAIRIITRGSAPRR